MGENGHRVPGRGFVMSKSIGGAAVLAVWATLLLPGGAQAWWLFNNDPHVPPDCSPGIYTPQHYWLPTLWKVKAYHHGVPGEPVSMHAEDRHPEVPPSFYMVPSHCPYEDPASYSTRPYPMGGSMAPEIVVEKP
jgi:hypothetical protein